MEHLTTSKMPLDDMKNIHVMESGNMKDMMAESKMPEIHVSIEKKGVESSVNPISDKPLRVEKNEWYNG